MGKIAASISPVAQIFSPSWNKLPIVAAIAGILAPTLAIAGVWYFFSPWYTDVGYRPVQPVPYSHKLHAGELGLDCRYCHASVERSADPGLHELPSARETGQREARADSREPPERPADALDSRPPASRLRVFH